MKHERTPRPVSLKAVTEKEEEMKPPSESGVNLECRIECESELL